jgi:hypothetical protein
MTPQQRAELAVGALDAACLYIQEKIGQDDGGVAGLFFSGSEAEQIIRSFCQYIDLELNLKEKA